MKNSKSYEESDDDLRVADLIGLDALLTRIGWYKPVVGQPPADTEEGSGVHPLPEVPDEDEEGSGEK